MDKEAKGDEYSSNNYINYLFNRCDSIVDRIERKVMKNNHKTSKKRGDLSETI